MDNRKVLFLCKRRQSSSGYPGVSFGLINSATFVADYLRSHGVRAEVHQVTDANDVDREVSNFNARVVVLEALWVTPEKLRELATMPRHTSHNRLWVVRVHSRLPFLANEGVAVEWLRAYASIPNVLIAPNTEELAGDLQFLGVPSLYLPNVVVQPEYVPNPLTKSKYVDIGCFGALRPMKNHLAQAVAALEFAETIHRRLRFHINVEPENDGAPVLKNLRSLFAGSNHRLVEQPWVSHAPFLGLVHKMDLGMQVSLSETFNIVAADFVSAGVPVVVSPDIAWQTSQLKANASSTQDMLMTLGRAWLHRPALIQRQREKLREYNVAAGREWLAFWRSAT
jgi:hypothetical protein